jgi:small subunit ribosomal protein S8
MTDPIADLLTRIRNAHNARKVTVTAPLSKQKLAVLEVLKKKKFISDYKTIKEGKFEEILVDLNPERSDITLKRISKAGQRIYIQSKNIKKINGGLGVALISTPKGVMTGEDAVNQNLGGEYICEVY